MTVVNFKSVEKIRNGANFLVWFRGLPLNLQKQVLPHLAQPYQTALNLLDCCNQLEYYTLAELAQTAQISENTARQVIKALRDGGMVFTVETAKGWKLVELNNFQIGKQEVLV